MMSAAATSPFAACLRMPLIVLRAQPFCTAFTMIVGMSPFGSAWISAVSCVLPSAVDFRTNDELWMSPRTTPLGTSTPASVTEWIDTRMTCLSSSKVIFESVTKSRSSVGQGESIFV